jgi:hypothetical protein
MKLNSGKAPSIIPIQTTLFRLDRMTIERDQLAKELQRVTSKLRFKDSVGLAIPRKPFDNLTEQRQKQILSEVNAYYQTDNLVLCSNDASEFRLTIEQSASFKAINNMTDSQYTALVNIGAPGMHFGGLIYSISFIVSPLHFVNKYGQDLLKRIGGYTESTINGARCFVASNISAFFSTWFTHVLEIEWNGKISDIVKLVLTGDGGKDLVLSVRLIFRLFQEENT